MTSTTGFPSPNVPAPSFGLPNRNEPTTPSTGGGGGGDHTVTDPRLAPLIAMFPTFDPAVMEGVLDACGGDQERAIDQLLGMSDPSYVPEALPESSNQTALDEEFAQRLQLEDQEQQQARSRAPQATTDTPSQRHSYDGSYSVPYQPRARPPPSRRSQEGYQSDGQYDQHASDQYQPGVSGYGHSNTWQGNQGSPGTTRAGGDFQDQFNKFAETGKKTFTSIVSKVKEKFREFESPPSQAPQGGSGRNHWSSWQGSVGSQPAAPAQPQMQHWNQPQDSQSQYDEPPWTSSARLSSSQNAYGAPSGPPPGSTFNPPPVHGYDVGSSFEPEPAYVTQSNPFSQSSTQQSPTTRETSESGNRNNPFLAPQEAPQSIAEPSPAFPTPSSPPAPAASVGGFTGVTTPTRMPSPQPIGGSSMGGAMNTPSPPPLDRAKLGLLPKRPVSLMGPPAAPSPPPPAPQRDDSLEYVDNPLVHGR